MIPQYNPTVLRNASFQILELNERAYLIRCDFDISQSLCPFLHLAAFARVLRQKKDSLLSARTIIDKKYKYNKHKILNNQTYLCARFRTQQFVLLVPL